MNDYIYCYTKDTFKKVLLGEVQTDFNMGFAIDGTKDSCKVIVHSFSGVEIQPQTIIKHENTNTWWVVSHDKVERNTNETGYYYVHNLQLLGAIELLNARDLTDSGYNDRRYTIYQFISRLLKLSNFEFANDDYYNIEVVSPFLDIDKVVDYIKTFENYTLLSALREFLDGYNCSIKLSFGEQVDQEHFGDNDLHIVSCSFNIVSKTGNSSIVLNEDSFSDVKETKTIDKNSFGTSVISNAENVISTKSKTFPSTGYVRLSSHKHLIDRDNAILRLPSNINKINWVDMVKPINMSFKYTESSLNGDFDLLIGFYDYNKIKSLLTEKINNWQCSDGEYVTQSVRQVVKDYYLERIDFLTEQVIKAMTTRFWYNDNYDPVSKDFISRTDISNFYMPKITCMNNTTTVFSGNVQTTNKELGQSVEKEQSAMFYERGKNEITNFKFLGLSSTNWSHLNNYDSTNLKEANKTPISHTFNLGTQEVPYIITTSCIFGSTNVVGLTPRNTCWKVNYIPMSDLKVKYDNSETSKDTQLYNQNGKLTDSNALSKLLLSYSKEIESDNITKFGTFYTSSLLGIPSVGDLVSLNGTTYVINNVSLDFYENEINPNNDSDKGYYVVGEFTLSKKIAVKSLMTNPNTNIRDYGIPQNNNVVRKQLYRDFYELSKTRDTLADTNYYLTLDKVLNLSNYYKAYQEHIAVIKVGYSSPIGGGGTDPQGNPTEASENWYYQLDTTTYMLKKAIYEVVNFNDNNIIGYSSQNIISGFFIERIFSGLIDTVNTPISYVDSSGELESIEIAMTTLDQLSDIYEAYQDKEEIELSQTYDGTLLNYSIFIPSDIYEGFEMSSQVSITNHTTSALNPTHATVGGQRVTRYNYDLVDNNLVPEDFTGSTSDITISNVSAVDENNNSVNIDSVSVLTGFVVRFQIQDDISSILRITFDISYTYDRHINGAKDSNDFMISELEYNKDALEVPFFEYSCQIDDSDDIVVGENVLDTNEGDVFAYSYCLVNSGIVNENNFLNLIQMQVVHADNDLVTNEPIAWWYNSANLEYSGNNILISLYGSCDELFIDREEVRNVSRVNLTESLFSGKDLIIVRHKINNNTPIVYNEQTTLFDYETINDLMFVIKGIKSANISDNKVVININHYNVK